MSRALVLAAVAWLAGCGGGQKESAAPPAELVKQVPAPKPADESRRFAKDNLVETKVVDRDLLGKSFMPGGTLAGYRKGKREYQMFVARAKSASDASLILLDWKKALADAKFVPSFGGYFGLDSGEPLFVFTKAEWVAGVKGLPQAEADLAARALAGRL